MSWSEKDPAKMHWRDRWEYEANLEYKALSKLPEEELDTRIKKGRVGRYYQLWRVIGNKGTLENSGMVLWNYLKGNPGDSFMHERYHCAAALFNILGMPDPASETEIRKRVQWDHYGEEARQLALLELEEIIHEMLESD
jgi:hypothetical protein